MAENKPKIEVTKAPEPVNVPEVIGVEKDVISEDRVRQIVAEALASFSTNERYTFQKHLQFFDGRNIQTGRTTGTKIGTATDQKVGFYNVTPVVQPSGPSKPTGGGDSDGDLRAQFAVLVDALTDLGLIG